MTVTIAVETESSLREKIERRIGDKFGYWFTEKNPPAKVTVKTGHVVVGYVLVGGQAYALSAPPSVRNARLRILESLWLHARQASSF